jgi:glycosyltransferase involved in cell wall biosynthesis
MSKGIVLYLRTDLADTDMMAGGSVAHTLGVIKGFVDLGYSVVCASSCLGSVLGQVPLQEVRRLSNPRSLRFLRWKINCFLSSFFFFFQTGSLLKKYEVVCIYQRYSLLNVTGVFLAWWYQKKLIVEYNGSDAWVADHWIKNKHFFSGTWVSYMVETFNLRHADSIIVVSDVLKDELVERNVPVQKILVNPNGVDVERFNPQRIKREQSI